MNTIQTKVIHCKRTTEVPLARGSILALKRRHWTLSLIANDFLSAATIRAIFEALIRCPSATDLATNDLLERTRDRPIFEVLRGPTRAEIVRVSDVSAVSTLPLGVVSSSVPSWAPGMGLSPRQPRQSIRKRRVP